MKLPSFSRMPRKASEAFDQAAIKILNQVESIFMNEFSPVTSKQRVKDQMMHLFPDCYQGTSRSAIEHSIENFINSSHILSSLLADDQGKRYGANVQFDVDALSTSGSKIMGCILIQFILVSFEDDPLFEGQKVPKVQLEEGRMYFCNKFQLSRYSETEKVEFEFLPMFDNFISVDKKNEDSCDRY